MTGSVIGSAGADTYYVDDATIQLQELATVGEFDQVFTAVSFRLAANIEGLTLLEAGDINGVGNAAANFMTGNSGENRLLGLDGNDTITGDVGNDKVWGCNGDDAVNGGAGDDTVLGNSGNDVVQGGDGDDLLIGGLGRDTIIGGNGADVFLFTSLAQSGATPALADAISDFISGEDIINLSKIDAKSNNTVADDAFIFIGSAAFSNVAGQMHAIQIAGNTFIEMDVNGDSVADCVIQLNGLLTMNAGDFVL